VSRKYDFYDRVELLRSTIDSTSISHSQIQQLLSAMAFTTPVLGTESHGAAASRRAMDYWPSCLV
jgi:hypothetical protein